jgi:hypothetical protein
MSSRRISAKSSQITHIAIQQQAKYLCTVEKLAKAEKTTFLFPLFDGNTIIKGEK